MSSYVNLPDRENSLYGDQQQRSFDKLKEALCRAETLGYFDKNAETFVMADASPVGLGAVLFQEQ